MVREHIAQNQYSVIVPYTAAIIIITITITITITGLSSPLGPSSCLHPYSTAPGVGLG